MDGKPTLTLTHHFRDLPDPRLAPLCEHELLDIIVIAVCAVICGQHSWTDIAFYGQDHYAWLKTFLRLPNGIPSHDTFRYVFTRLDPEAFQRCFAAWIGALSQATDLQHIAIDGKALRGSRQGGKAALHLVSAWATHNHLTLGQVAVADKSNEITAIPRLLELLDVSGAIVTIDARGCQKDMQETRTEHLDRTVGQDEGSYWETVDLGHGRRAVRTSLLVTELEAIRDRELWQDWHGLCLAVNERTIAGVTSVEAGYYLGSLHGTVADYARVIRDHWGIENSCHWILDVTFREDHCRNRPEHGAENLAWLRSRALSLLKNDTTCDRSIRAKSAKALAEHDFWLQLLSRVSGEKEGA